MEIPSSAFFLIQILFFTVDDTFANIFTLCSIYKIFEKWREVMVLKFINFEKVLKKYGKWFLKMRDIPEIWSLKAPVSQQFLLMIRTTYLIYTIASGGL